MAVVQWQKCCGGNAEAAMSPLHESGVDNIETGVLQLDFGAGSAAGTGPLHSALGWTSQPEY